MLFRAIPFEFLRGTEGKPKIKMCGEGSVTKIKYVGRGSAKNIYNFRTRGLVPFLKASLYM